jgi:hypothetical protein
MFLNLPDILSLEVIGKWIPRPIKNLVLLDTALCNKQLRDQFLLLLESEFFMLRCNLKVRSSASFWLTTKRIKVSGGLRVTGNEFSNNVDIPNFLSNLNVRNVSLLKVYQASLKVQIINSTLGHLINRCILLTVCSFVGCEDRSNKLWTVVHTDRLSQLTKIDLHRCSQKFNYFAIISISQICRNLIVFSYELPRLFFLYHKSCYVKETDFIKIIQNNPSMREFSIQHETLTYAFFEALKSLEMLVLLEIHSTQLVPMMCITNLVTPILEVLDVRLFDNGSIKYTFDARGKCVCISERESEECETFFQQIHDFDSIELTVQFHADDFTHVLELIAENNRSLKVFDVSSDEMVWLPRDYLIPIFKIPGFQLCINECFEDLTSGVVKLVDGLDCFVYVLNTEDRSCAFFNPRINELLPKNHKLDDVSYYSLVKTIKKILSITRGFNINEIDDFLEVVEL